MRKPKIGVLGLILQAYEPLFPGICARQDAYVRQMLGAMPDCADFVFPKVAATRDDIEELCAQYNADGLDGILIFLLSYSQGQYLVRAMQHNHLPLALALVQPNETVDDNFEELDFTVNQGIHGSQDNANCLLRAGIQCSYFAGSRINGELSAFVGDFACAAMAKQIWQHTKIAVIGKLPGMGDVITDDMAVYRKLGPEFVYDSIGTVQRHCAGVTQKAITSRIAFEQDIFEIDPTLTHAAHEEAVRMYLGLKQYLHENNYAGYTAHFEEFGEDGRFTQLPLLAASSLMADGFGYAAEGDATCAALGAAMHTLCGIMNFSEMYMMDLVRDAILFCHAGEGNWKTARTDRKPYLKNRVLTEGGLANPPTPIFAPQPGRCTVLTLVHNGDERFTLVCAHGEILDKADLKNCDMPYLFFKPDSGVRDCVRRWLEVGGTHHEVIVFGEHQQKLRLFCKMLGIQLEEV